MIVCPAIGRAFVHMPKTGGTSWRNALGTTPGFHLLGRQHRPAAVLSESARLDLRVFGIYRPPEAWYPSLYAHAMLGKGAALARLRAWTGGSTEWPDVLEAWTSGAIPPAAIDCPGVIWEHEGPAAWQPGEGLWSWTMRHFFQWPAGGWAVDTLIHIDDSDAEIDALGLAHGKRRNVRLKALLPVVSGAQAAAIAKADGAMMSACHGLMTREEAA